MGLIMSNEDCASVWPLNKHFPGGSQCTLGDLGCLMTYEQNI